MLLISAATAYGMLALPTAGIYVCAFLNGTLRSGVIAALMMTPVLLKEIGPKNAGTAGGFIITLQLLGCVVVPTYLIVPLAGGNMTTFFSLGTVCFALKTAGRTVTRTCRFGGLERDAVMDRSVRTALELVLEAL